MYNLYGRKRHRLSTVRLDGMTVFEIWGGAEHCSGKLGTHSTEIALHVAEICLGIPAGANQVGRAPTDGSCFKNISSTGEFDNLTWPRIEYTKPFCPILCNSFITTQPR